MTIKISKNILEVQVRIPTYNPHLFNSSETKVLTDKVDRLVLGDLQVDLEEIFATIMVLGTVFLVLIKWVRVQILDVEDAGVGGHRQVTEEGVGVAGDNRLPRFYPLLTKYVIIASELN